MCIDKSECEINIKVSCKRVLANWADGAMLLSTSTANANVVALSRQVLGDMITIVT
jgi:hypothetical protein